MSKNIVLKPGLTWRTYMALVYAAILVAPIDVFLLLHMGTTFLSSGPGFTIAPPALYVILILFTEIARLTMSPLTRQEVFIIYNLLGVAMNEVLFSMLIYQGYFRISHLSWFLTDISGKRLIESIPTWYAPSRNIFLMRSFLNSGWAIPIAVMLMALLFTLISEVGLGLLMGYLFVEVENLPFPTAPVAAEGILTISERDPLRVKIFALSAVISIVWSALTFGVPTPIGGSIGIRQGLLSFIDITPWLSKFMPGAIMGVTFEPFPYTFGFILPGLKYVLSMLVASYAIWFFGNWLVLRIKAPMFSDIQKIYTPTMTTGLLQYWSYNFVWASFLMGAALGVTIILVIRGWKFLAKAIVSLSKLKSIGQSGYLPLSFIMMLWIGGVIGYATLIMLLVPDFPKIILILFLVLLPFLNALLNARGLGEVGFGVSIPYPKQLMILVSGYNGTNIWYAPIYPFGYGMGNVAAQYTYTIKVAKLTETNPLDYFKALFFIIPITWIMSFIVTSLFWQMAPIPSQVYPATTTIWPESMTRFVFFMKNFRHIYKFELIGIGFVIMSILALLSSILPIPLQVMAMMWGFNLMPYHANALAIGWLVGKILFEKKFGKEKWNTYKNVVLAGVTCGYGVVAAVAATTLLISRALWHTVASY